MKLLIGINHTYPVRNSMVLFMTKFSTSADLRCGVPQGSILGPLLFLLHINDIPQAVDCGLFIYANDTCFLFQQKDLERIKKDLTKNFSNICDRFEDNKLRRIQLWGG